jgi:hypothetical protein
VQEKDEKKDATPPVPIQFRPRSAKQSLQPVAVEIEVYLHLLIVIYLLDKGKAK